MVILATGWEYADPVISVAIGILILASSWGDPPRLGPDPARGLARRASTSRRSGRRWPRCPGVKQVHDLHVWTITSGFPALAAHVLVERDTDCHATRRELERCSHERFGLDHTTLQVDHEGGELLQIET